MSDVTPEPVRPGEERVLRLLRRFAPTKHTTGCPMHIMHDDFYENPDPDEHPDYPRRCDCGFDEARAALAADAEPEGES